jgi:methanogenic corrinoid protein MtbC1
MGSMMRCEQDAAAALSDRPARTFTMNSVELDAFRIHAITDYDRSLTSLIESEIIPRLMVEHAAEPAPSISPGGEQITKGEIEPLTSMVMDVEADTLLDHVEAVLARGVCMESVMVDLLAPAARLLGEFWEEDRCDFVDVTMGLWRLQEVVREMASRVPAKRFLAARGHRALFASMPGDQHWFGTVVIDELFRCNGWLTERVSDAETAELLKWVESDWFDIIGLTISCDCHIAGLRSIIAALRNVSRNPLVCVMVGGRVFVAKPELAEQVGADGTARDAKLALKIAADLVRQREREAADCN